MTFSDHGEIVLENYEVQFGDEVLVFYIKATYEVKCEVEFRPHNVPMGEDSPDGAECYCSSITIEDMYPCDEDGNEILDVTLPSDVMDRITQELKELAVNDYYDNGSWRPH